MPRARPLSPHLQIYKFTITMAMSIIHRITGIALYAGTVLLVLWLAGAAIGGVTFFTINWLFGTWFGQFVLFGYTWALLHHLLGGIRHFIWDTGTALEPGQREALAWANLIGSIVLSLGAWALWIWWGMAQ